MIWITHTQHCPDSSDDVSASYPEDESLRLCSWKYVFFFSVDTISYCFPFSKGGEVCGVLGHSRPQGLGSYELWAISHTVSRLLSQVHQAVKTEVSYTHTLCLIISIKLALKPLPKKKRNQELFVIEHRFHITFTNFNYTKKVILLIFCFCDVKMVDDRD